MPKRKKCIGFEDLLIYVDLAIADAYDEFEVREVEQLKRCMDRIYVILDRLKKKYPYIYEWLMATGAYV